MYFAGIFQIGQNLLPLAALAFDLRPGVGFLGFGLVQRSHPLFYLRLVYIRVDAGQNLADPYGVSFFDEQLDNFPGNVGADFYFSLRKNLATGSNHLFDGAEIRFFRCYFFSFRFIACLDGGNCDQDNQ